MPAVIQLSGLSQITISSTSTSISEPTFSTMITSVSESPSHVSVPPDREHAASIRRASIASTTGTMARERASTDR